MSEIGEIKRAGARLRERDGVRKGEKKKGGGGGYREEEGTERGGKGKNGTKREGPER